MNIFTPFLIFIAEILFSLIVTDIVCDLIAEFTKELGNVKEGE